MLYLVALKEWQHPKKEQPVCYGPEEFNDRQIAGVRYNVVKRPLSGGKGTIVRYKPSKTHPYGEPKEAFYKRVAAYIQEEPQEFFMRWRVEVGQHDIQKFQHECLNPLLESLCDWWSWVKLSQQGSNYGPFSPNDGCENSVDRQVNSYIHWRHPFGVYNAMDEGGSTDLDEYLSTGSELGLTRVDNLFPELEAV
jgi:hypothetical protein